MLDARERALAELAAPSPARQRGLADDVELLGDALGDAVRADGGDVALELTAPTESLAACDAQRLARALTRHLQLVNLAEDNDRIRRLRRDELACAPDPPGGSLAAAVTELAGGGVSADDMRALLAALEVRLVLTAHPTEARRRTTVEKQARAFAELRRLDERAALPREEREARERLCAVVEELWRTDDARANALTVLDEVNAGLVYLGTTLYEVVPRVYRDLEAALSECYPGERIAVPALLRFGSWIGGDRDGNPNVTAAVTREAIGVMRDACLALHEIWIRRLAPQVSLSSRLGGNPAVLVPLLADFERRAPEAAARLTALHPHEPYRRVLELIAARVADTRAGEGHGYGDSAELVGDLRTVAAALRAQGADRVAAGELRDMIRRVEVFGFHFARLDVRQHAKRHRSAVAELLSLSGVTSGYEDLGDQARCMLVDRELDDPRPLLGRDRRAFTPETQELLGCLDDMRALREEGHGGALGRYIISHAGASADMLDVLLLMRETGLAGIGGEDAVLQIAPLLEADDTLIRGAAIVGGAVDTGTYRRALMASGGVQEVMIGYSDSNKDVGYVASTWSTRQAQAQIGRELARRGIGFRFFHGRGGSVGRGGGPANLAIPAQPPSTLDAGLDVTEQGEVIAEKYSSTEIAQRELELTLNAVLRAAGGDADGPPEERLAIYEGAMERMAASSRAAYRELIHDEPGLTGFFRTVTPVGEIERLRLGSRPASRGGGDSIDDLRAIPWVFAWTQARLILPAWYGLGTALAGIRESEGDELLSEMAAGWPFFATLLSNAEMGLAKVDLAIAERYVSLAPEGEERDRIWSAIRTEHELTVAELLRANGQDELLERDPVLRRSIERRAPYLDALSAVQVELTRRTRAGDPDPELARASAMVVNGIAGGLRNTG